MQRGKRIFFIYYLHATIHFMIYIKGETARCCIDSQKINKSTREVNTKINTQLKRGRSKSKKGEKRTWNWAEQFN